MVRRVVDHVTLVVEDFARSDAFYTGALAALGFERLNDLGPTGGIAFGVDGADDFAIFAAGEVVPTTTAHVAFVAENRAAVVAFHAAALAAGGTERAAPGIRPEYSAGYYAAFVSDPDGNNIEAVFHEPGAAAG